MSLKVIIIAVLALIILVVLILIFTGKTSLFTKGTGDTASQYGSDKCKIPGTSRECADDENTCRQKGGSYNAGPFSDCFDGGCCTL